MGSEAVHKFFASMWLHATRMFLDGGFLAVATGANLKILNLYVAQIMSGMHSVECSESSVPEELN